MIGDVVKRSLKGPSVLIPVQELLQDGSGSRMPDVNADLLTKDIAKRVVAACPTSAFTLDESDNRSCLILNYGECIGCSRCVQAGEGALLPAKKFARCGVDKEALIRR